MLLYRKNCTERKKWKINFYTIYIYLMSLCEGLFAKSDIHFEVKDDGLKYVF